MGRGGGIRERGNLCRNGESHRSRRAAGTWEGARGREEKEGLARGGNRRMGIQGLDRGLVVGEGRGWREGEEGATGGRDTGKEGEEEEGGD